MHSIQALDIYPQPKKRKKRKGTDVGGELTVGNNEGSGNEQRADLMDGNRL
ncbi:hypothetical protein BYT27DRAFT_7202498 [Phlegmacium glaucopus]|nr:hypothetical protein BYT27DRAFT_7202498 [Phlegmacium glaucopus]